jgi:hypothetical protein
MRRGFMAVALLGLLSLCGGCLGRAQPSTVMKWCEMHNKLVIADPGHHHHGQQRLRVDVSQIQGIRCINRLLSQPRNPYSLFA